MSYCKHPDRDVPALTCGYPLPCPWHTAIIDTTEEPTTVTVPATATAAQRNVSKLAEIARALGPEPEPEPERRLSVGGWGRHFEADDV